MRPRRALACLLVAAALAAACASEADLGADDRTAAERRADEAAAGKMLLTLDDLPAGFRAAPADPFSEASQDRIDATLARCLHVSRNRFDRDDPRATSPTFATPDNGTVIRAEVTVTPSTAWAASQMDLYLSDAAPRCYALVLRQDLAERAVAPSVDVGEPTVGRLDVPNLGDEAVTFRMTVRLTQGGRTAWFYFTALLARVGRIGITTTFATQGKRFDPGEAADLTRLIVDRAPTT